MPETTGEETENHASVIDIVDAILRSHLSSRESTSAAVDVWLALRRAGLLKDDDHA